VIKRIIRIALRRKNEILRRAFPISPAILSRTLDRLVTNKTDVLFVHSSLSSLGFITGGAGTVVSALRKKCNTLVLPTHTYCYPVSGKPDGTVYNPETTKSLVGAISDWFWQQPGVVRSLHPTHSLAATGTEAKEICAGHNMCDTPCGAGTPYEKLLNRRAAVLMLGCTMNTYTLFHTSEHLAKCPYLYYPDPTNVSYVDTDGQAVAIRMWRQNMEYPRRFTSMEEELEGSHLLVRMKFRAGTLLYIPDALDVHNYLMERLKINPKHLLRDS
jgi:aminoglycoside 3-N-acetyltransferase